MIISDMSEPPTPRHHKNVKLTPPDSQADLSGATGDFNNRSKKYIIFLSTLVFLLGGVLLYGVLFLLPQHASQPTTDIAQTIEAENLTPSPPQAKSSDGIEQTGEDEQKQKARDILKEFLVLHDEYKLDNIHLWGGEQFSSISSLVAAGDELFRNNDYTAAATNYAQALNDLQALYTQKESIFSNALQEGTEQLEKGNGKAAEIAFELALDVHPDSKDAQMGLIRARNLESVLRDYSAGQELENSGDLTAALQSYKKAYDLDNDFQPAADGIVRLGKILQQKKLQQLLSQFHRDMQRGALSEAEASLNAARGMSPEDSRVIGALAEFNLAREERTINRLRSRAEKLSENEQWQLAISAYEQVLKLAPTASFALQGREFSQKQLDLTNRLDQLLKHPERFQNDSALQNAQETLLYAKAQTDSGPKMEKKITALETAVNRALSKVQLTLYSDNLTEVTIYHVARFGKFHQKELVLRPGKYTIIGERAGFRVVRDTITLSYDQPSVDFTIVCRERI